MKNIYLILLFSFSVLTGFAQENSLKTALDQYQAGDLETARKAIDQCIEDEQLKTDPKTWYLRGFIYKDLYKNDPKGVEATSQRIVAQKAFQQLLNMPGTEQFATDALKNFKYLSTTFYNDAISGIESGNFEEANSLFDHFKENLSLSKDTSIDVNKQEIDFLLALGSGYSEAFKHDTTANEQWLNKAEDTFKKVLTKDSVNSKANYNLGVLYYNQAVSLINDMNYDEIDLVSISQIEDQSIALFKQSLPFMELAYQQNPNDANTLEGLAGIYFSLREYDKSNEFKAKLESLEKQN